jgi:UDP-N-acetylglucosamine 2-epimerase (non-hydrolysing)
VNLADEGIVGRRVVVTGNTVVEAVHRLLPEAGRRAGLLGGHGLEPGGYVLATFHRPENVDDPDKLAAILTALTALPLRPVLPLHPRTRANVTRFGLEGLLERITVLPPMGYRDFLGLAAEAALLISDSGGIQEEASIIKRPVIVVRNSTERPEVLGTFAALVPPGPGIGEQAALWLDDLAGLHNRLTEIPSPYGDGSAARLIVEAMDRMLGLA